MAKITANHMFVSISGKLCKKESTYISYNQKTGKMYSAEYHHPENATVTEAQETAQAAFTKKAQLASAWWNKNKASNTDAFQMVMAAYDKQSKIGNPYAFLRTLVTDGMKVVLAGNDITNGATAGSGSSQSGSSSQSGGTNIEG